MRTGILTFFDTKDNYGQILQCYAMINYLQSKGLNPCIIKYHNNSDSETSLKLKVLKFLNPKVLFRKIKSFSKIKKNVEIIDRGFDKFRSIYFPFYEKEYFSYDELKRNPPQVDMIVVGSDQVWNVFDPEGNANIKTLNAYMLGFVPDSVKKVAIAPSFGRDKIKKKEYKKIEKLLKRFDLVTVREQAGLNICHKCNIFSAKWVIDPTLYFNADFYIKKFSISKTFEEPFLLLYYVDNGGGFDIKDIYKFAATKGLKVKYVTANLAKDNFNKIYPSIENWLSDVANAEYVITNSFHCCIFSIIFGKRFGVIQIKGINSCMNSRIESLFKITHIDKRIVYNDDFSCLDLPTEKYVINAENNFDTYLNDILKKKSN